MFYLSDHSLTYLLSYPNSRDAIASKNDIPYMSGYKGIGIDWGVFYPSVNHQGQGNRNNAISTVENSNLALASIRIRSEQLRLQTETHSNCR